MIPERTIHCLSGLLAGEADILADQLGEVPFGHGQRARHYQQPPSGWGCLVTRFTERPITAVAARIAAANGLLYPRTKCTEQSIPLGNDYAHPTLNRPCWRFTRLEILLAYLNEIAEGEENFVSHFGSWDSASAIDGVLTVAMPRLHSAPLEHRRFQGRGLPQGRAQGSDQYPVFKSSKTTKRPPSGVTLFRHKLVLNGLVFDRSGEGSKLKRRRTHRLALTN